MENLTEEKMDSWIERLEDATGRWEKTYDFRTYREEVKEKIEEMKSTSIDEVSEDELDDWHQTLQYAVDKFRKTPEWSGVKDDIEEVAEEIRAVSEG